MRRVGLDGEDEKLPDDGRLQNASLWDVAAYSERRNRAEHNKPEACNLMPDASIKIRVLVRPKDGILDPQGEAVRGALPALGFGGVRTVHIGRLIEMEVESADEVDAMCRRLLSNPTIEEYEWEVVS